MKKTKLKPMSAGRTINQDIAIWGKFQELENLIYERVVKLDDRLFVLAKRLQEAESTLAFVQDMQIDTYSRGYDAGMLKLETKKQKRKAK